MTWHDFFSAAFGLAAALAAVNAARLSGKASRISIQNPIASISDVPELHILSTQVAFNESSRFNKSAARWAWGAALCSVIASILAFPTPSHAAGATVK